MDARVIAQAFLPNLAGAAQPESGQCEPLVSLMSAGVVSPDAGRTLAEKNMHLRRHGEDYKPILVEAVDAYRVTLSDTKLAARGNRLKPRWTGWRFDVTGKYAREGGVVRHEAPAFLAGAKEAR